MDLCPTVDECPASECAFVTSHSVSGSPGRLLGDAIVKEETRVLVNDCFAHRSGASGPPRRSVGVGDSGGEKLLDGDEFLFGEFVARPEKTAQAVAAFARHDVNVEMRNYSSCCGGQSSKKKRPRWPVERGL